MWRIAFLLAVITVIGGVTPIGARVIVAQAPPLTVAWFRFGLAGLLLWATVRARGRRLRLERGNLRPLLLLGLVCVPINQLGFLVGIQLANGSHASVFYGLVPVMVYWLAVARKQMAPSRTMLIAAILAFAGVAAVVRPSLGVVGAGGRSYVAGDLFLLLAATSWGVFVTYSRPYIQRFGALRTLAAVFLLGAAAHTPVMIAGELLWESTDISAITGDGLLGFAWITLMTSYLNYLLIYIVVARHNATRAMIVANAGVLITVGIEWRFFNEPLTGWFFAGMGLMFGAIGLDGVRAWAANSHRNRSRKS
jgi:drug/metabolite transporter (DMT)-like permease